MDATGQDILEKLVELRLFHNSKCQQCSRELKLGDKGNLKGLKLRGLALENVSTLGFVSL